MAPPVEQQFYDLLHPIKDVEKSFQIDISELLHQYMNSFVRGSIPANFNSAALLLQGSSSIYGKKVEYLFNLATQLYQNLVKNKKDEQAKKETNKAKDKQKDHKFNDPFFSTEIKIGKNLSCLKKKNLAKHTGPKKPKKEKKNAFVPVDLLPFDGEEKGDMIYDTRNDAVGYKADYTLTKCCISSSGWLILPTVSLDQIPLSNCSDYTFHCNAPCNNIDENHMDDDSHCFDDDMVHSTPDEGINMDFQSPSVQSSQATTVESSQGSSMQSSQGIPLSQQTDEGLSSLHSTPLEPSSQTLSEPMDVDIAGETPDTNQSVLRRRSERLKPSDVTENTESAPIEDGNVQEDKVASKEDEIVVVKKAIQKKNTCNLPSKLKSKENEDKNNYESISQYCARTFFSVDNKFLKNGLSLETTAFKNNTLFIQRLQERMDTLKNASRKCKKTEENEEEDEDVDVEALKEPDPDDMMAADDLDDGEIVIQNDINDILPDSGTLTTDIDVPISNLPFSSENEVPILSEEPIEEDDALMKDMKLDKNSEITARVKAFEKRLSPFLEELDKREAFDINLYGSRILSSFDSSSDTKVRKQTKTFQDFCKGMEQWQIHRYFMALLPLANVGNVSLEAEEGPDGEEQIMITLLSKKMHHLRVEEFHTES